MKVDNELLEFIKSLPNDLTYCEKLNKIIQWKKDNRGLLNFHASVYPTNNSVDAESNAKSILLAIRSSAEGKTKDITNSNL